MSIICRSLNSPKCLILVQGVFNRKQVREEVMSMVEDIGLVEKKDIQASKLSGGMKRKLRYIVC